jgi:Tol biopolymer transport system component
MRSPVPLTTLRLAFTAQDQTGYREIYTMRGDGSEQTRLTNNQAYNSDPVWSPQGTRIAYVSAFRQDSDLRDIYVVNAGGSGQTRLTNGAGTNTSPAWSPDGTRIAFVSTRSGNAQIYLVNVNDVRQTPLTFTTATEDCPAWSPDGAKIAFVSTRDGESHIYLMNADGSGQARLSSTAATEDCPVWSPDGTKIAFVAHSDSNSNELNVVMLATGARIPVFNNPDPQKQEMGIYYPEWSPDSTQLLFNVQRSVFPYSAYIIYLIMADGSEAQPREIGAGIMPTWSPDGAWIAYSTNVFPVDLKSHIEVINASGTQRIGLTDQSGAPVWAPLPIASP